MFTLRTCVCTRCSCFFCALKRRCTHTSATKTRKTRTWSPQLRETHAEEAEALRGKGLGEGRGVGKILFVLVAKRWGFGGSARRVGKSQLGKSQRQDHCVSTRQHLPTVIAAVLQGRPMHSSPVSSISTCLSMCLPRWRLKKKRTQEDSHQRPSQLKLGLEDTN